MERLLNTLFVTTQGSYLARKGETVCVRNDGETKLRFPVHNLGSIVCFGRVSWSAPLMHLCAENGVTLSFLTRYGKFCGRVQGPISGNVLLRREQYRKADNQKESAELTRSIITAKIGNSRTVLQRARRDHSDKTDTESLKRAVRRTEWALNGLDKCNELSEMRGREGEAARAYFSVFDHLIVSQENDFIFSKRNRRPPLDPVNALLSFLYTLVLHDCISALESVGLDPAVGFLHRDRPGRPGLALDIMEEFRAFLADRTALSLINRRQVKPEDFRTSESGAVRMNEGARETLLETYQKRKQEEIQHPYLEERIKIGMLPHAQALLMARMIRGDLEVYPAFIWR